MKKIRSGPVYVETDRGTISLVFEANARDSDDAILRPVGRLDVYVIDEDGVRLVRRRNRLLRALAVGAIAYCLMLAISFAFKSKRPL